MLVELLLAVAQIVICVGVVYDVQVVYFLVVANLGLLLVQFIFYAMSLGVASASKAAEIVAAK